MWIRSQDNKALENCENIFKDIDFKNNICISCITKNNTYSILGYYSSEEKALKVLDMIQQQINICVEQKKIIRPATINAFEPYESKSYIVFQMPQDDEVES